MAITKQSRIEKIEIYPATGFVSVLIKKELVENGVVLLAENHRTGIDPDGPGIAAQMAAVNDHLAEMGFPAVAVGDVAVLDTHASAAKTERVKSK